MRAKKSWNTKCWVQIYRRHMDAQSGHPNRWGDKFKQITIGYWTCRNIHFFSSQTEFDKNGNGERYAIFYTLSHKFKTLFCTIFIVLCFISFWKTFRTPKLYL